VPFSSGALTSLKLVGLLSMTVDHINKYLYHGASEAAFAMGRLALPVFVSVVAVNLAKARGPQTFSRMAQRLAVAGVVATLPYSKLGGLLHAVYPFNVLFTLLTLVCVLSLRTQGRGKTAAIAFLGGGALAEFWWPALILGVGVFDYSRRPSIVAAVTVLVGLASLSVINGNGWAFCALPLLVLGSRICFPIPRMRLFFYAFYPAHLFAILIARIPLERAGHLYL